MLAGLSAQTFLRRHWQKSPLLARGALAGCGSIADRETLFELAARDDVESRLVRRHGGRWLVEHGPFDARRLKRLPPADWTLLVQGVNHFLPAAQRLVDRFAFVPYARLDDLMASYAPDGGGVGPHFDEYDVFLVQAAGRRRWRVSRQRDLALVPGAALKLLRRFRPQREWVLDAGDLLYLPPRCAHDGVAVGGDCITLSVGFRAFGAQELAAGFLDFLQQRLQLAGRYEDPGLRPARRPARLDDALVRAAQGFITGVRWTGRDIERFLGCHLTEPKAHVVFRRPARPLPQRAFSSQAARLGLRLALPTRMLYRHGAFFINGEAVDAGATAARLLARLADRRALPPRLRLDRESSRLLYPWYRAGYILVGES